MSWQQVSAMGAGNGVGGGNNAAGQEMGAVPGNGSGQPQATEYTLQGVMRFLQTEWHRHERDRNAWEIERQEMKGRIAALEGSARRGDATQKALRRYVNILEKKVKDQAQQLKVGKVHDTTEGEHAVKHPPIVHRQALIAEKLKSSSDKPKDAMPGLEGLVGERVQEDEERDNLKAFLDQCQAEFTYLMITPANPMPPRESPPLPLMEDMREGDFGMPAGLQPLDAAFQALRLSQNHVKDLASRPQSNANHHGSPMQQQQQQQPQQPQQNNNFLNKNTQDIPSASIVRSGENATALYSNPTDWPPSVGVAVTNHEEPALKPNHNNPDPPRSVNAEGTVEKRASTEADGWDFSEGSFADPAPNAQSLPHVPSHRPDTDAFPAAESLPKSPNRSPNAHRRKSSISRRRSTEPELSLNSLSVSQKPESGMFKLRYGLRGHLNTVRTVIFSGGGSPGEPEICTAGDDGLVKRFHIPRDSPAGHLNSASDLDVSADFTHRGHTGAVLCLASWSPSPNFSTGGRAQGDGWIFSGGQDASIRVWERGRVDPKATIDGHTDAVWAVCVLPATLGAIFGQVNNYGTPDRILLVSGAADGAVNVWAVSAPPQLSSPQPAPGALGSRRGGSGRVRGNSMSSGSQFPNSPQPNMTPSGSKPFHSTLIHNITRSDSNGEKLSASPTCITPLGANGEAFVVSYADASIVVFDTRTGEQVGSMASLETYDGTPATGVNAVVATTSGLEQASGGNLSDQDEGGGPTGGGSGSAGSGVEGVIISGHEDRFVRFFDANSGQNTYTMLAHPASISSLSLSPDGRELVSAGHDASLRFWSLEKRSCTQEITSHRIMRGEGVCSVVWSRDGRWVVSAGGDGGVRVFGR
ncbi:WD40-repeat-containing domain protein [Pseudomassariella vexata]|uniref:WD40-repeat-containing domain protein n=1 Tax=Pseudomassariella vexata TaxID=1141098 RepID=A0A1Y2DC35_9PEZI|nr:WD40-repeat-containing domain protein [Pseudomassariella vexata]ORY56830.1 WD40-repeat-containing domain protein [Pseudomassariella vexata]